MSFPMVALAKVVRDLTNERIVQVKPDEEVTDPTIKSSTHKISVASIQKGVSVKISKRIRIEPNDLVFSRLHTQNGAFAFADRSYLATTTFLPLAIDEKQIDKRFLFWTLHVRVPTLSASDTVGRETYKTQDILNLEIPLPPLSKQRRIVVRIEELAAKIEEAHKLRHQAVEEGEALVKSTLATMVISLVERTGSRQLGDLIIDAGYGTSIKCGYERMKDSIPVLRIPNVASEQINFDDMKYGLLSGAELKRVLVEEGDVLLVRTNGSADLVGRCAVVPALPEPTAFASYMIRLRCYSEILTPAYLQLLLKHLRTEGHLIDFARTTAGQYNVSLGRLRAAKITLPPLPEQRRIVAYLDALQAKVDALRRLQTDTSAELDALLPAVLDRAFKGEL